MILPMMENFLALITFQCLMIWRISTGEDRIVYTLFEESPAYTFVGNIPESANLNSTLASNLLFSILSANSNPESSYFMIDESEGDLRTRQRIDREKICPQREECRIKLEIGAKSPPDYFQVVKVAVDVEDENDDVPKFADSQISRAIPENTVPGRSFSVPLAVDLDSPKFGVAEYRKVSGPDDFKVKMTLGEDGKPDGLYIVLDKELDREQRDIYQMTIAALDGGVPPNTGTLSLVITIQDVDDHPPHFTDRLFEAQVEENVEKGKVIMQVTAEDEDEGDNGVILYSFDAKTERDVGKLFHIDEATGTLSVVGDLDREERDVYELHVTAQDKDGEWLPSEAKVRVKVIDLNDNAPQVAVEVITLSEQVEIYEDEPEGSYLAYITANDADSGINGVFACTLDNPDFTLKLVDQDGSQAKHTLMTTKSLDREFISYYDLEIICADQGSPSLTSTSSVSVTVKDINDNAPAFSESAYMVEVPEDTSPGSVVLQVVASDRDEGANGAVWYSFNHSSDFFTIAKASGNISTTRKLDFETIQNYTLTIRAQDMGSPPTTSYATLIIKVTDINDEAPRFSPLKNTFGVSEAAEFGHRVGQVTALDPDSVGGGGPVFSIEGPPSAKDVFTISEDTGEIFTQAALDREMQAGYTLIVKATDGEIPRLSSTATVSIYVIDVNDNFPIIDYPSASNNTIHIPNTDFIGKEVTRIRAHDVDGSAASQVAYYLTGDEDSLNFFSINEVSGQIFTRKSLEAFTRKSFLLDILVRDSGSPPKTVQTQIYVVVNSSLAAQSTKASVFSNSNMVIIIAVVVVSAVLVILLIVAIIVVKRNDDRLTKSTYLRRMFAGQLGDKSEAKVIVDGSRSRMEAGYTNNISIADECPADEEHKQIKQVSDIYSR